MGKRLAAISLGNDNVKTFKYLQMNMKKLLVLSLLFIATHSAKAQDNFIEVIVTDTVWVEPDTYIYHITISPDEHAYEELRYREPKVYKSKVKQDQLQRSKLMDSIVTVIKKNNYKIIPPTVSELYQFLGENEYKIYSTDVIVSSVDSLRILYELISTSKSLVATVEGSYNENQLEGIQLLYKKLVVAAGEKAASLAALSKRKLGVLLSIKENTIDKESNTGGGWTIYPPLSSLSNTIIPGWVTNIKTKRTATPPNEQVITAFPIRNSLTVRFLLE